LIKIEVHSTRAVIRSQEPLTVGLTGAKAHFSFGKHWETLIKTVVFRQRDKTVTVAQVEAEVTIPWEVLTLPGVPVSIGVYGSDSEGRVAIPTVWAITDPVRPGADPEGDPSVEPTPGLWEQMLGKLDGMEKQLEGLEPQKVHVIMVHQTDGGTYEADHSMSMIREMLNANIPFTCYWYDKNIMMHLAGFQTNAAFEFTAVAKAKEYRIVITEDGVDHYVTDLANVTRVTLIPQGDGSYKTDPPFADILAANKAGHAVFCQNGTRVMQLVAASNLLCAFACVHNGVEHKVLVNPVGVEVTATPLSAGAGVTILDDGNGNVTINTTTASVTDATE
jgi:hypothetical protein